MGVFGVAKRGLFGHWTRIGARFALLVPLVTIAGSTLVGCDSDDDKESDDPQEYAYVKAEQLNVRSGPGMTYSVLTILARDERVEVLVNERYDGWIRVRLPQRGETGWVAERYLSRAGSFLRTTESLQEVVNDIVEESNWRSPGTETGLAILNLTTGEYAGSGDDVRHVSASSAKVIWVAAAMRVGANVDDIAEAIFERSDNVLAGTAMDRAGGIDEVNEFYWKVAGMEKSLVANWNHGRTRRARNQGVMDGDNYFTPRDVITFLSKLDRDQILPSEQTEKLLTYMTWSPRSGYGGWLGTRLPELARATIMHKAGWLAPPSYTRYSTLNEIGIIKVPAGQRYAIAMLTRRGNNYDAQARYVERASCVVYRALSQDASVSCPQ